MPLELGVFLGAKYFGGRQQKRKACLILDRDNYRYQKFISDIAGQDIQAHRNAPQDAMTVVRNWLRSYSRASLPSGSIIWSRYQTFKADLPLLCRELRLEMKELIYNDYVLLVSTWLRINT
jgi:hypothetical protein